MKLDIVITGVGGQGNLLASVALANYGMSKGLEVFGTETIGAAQRGGSVVSHIRMSDKKIYSPLVPDGQANLLIAFEPGEAARNLHLLNAQGKFIINDYQIQTVMCNMGLDTYPTNEEILAILKGHCTNGYVIPATTKALEMGNQMMTNVFMLGALAAIEPFFDKEELKAVVTELIPQKVLEKNLEAYEVGYNFIANAQAEEAVAATQE